MAENLRDFVVGLGFDIDDSGQRKFTQALEGATLRAKLLGDGLEAMAREIASSVADVASNFEKLFYSSQRVGAGVESIRAFQYAVSQLGGTAEGANQSLEAFGRNLRINPGFESFIQKSFGIQTRVGGVAGDNAQVLLDIGDKLSHMPKYLAERYREMLGIDEPTLLAIERGAQVHERFNESLRSQGAAGIDGVAAARAAQFEQSWRDVWQRIGNMAEGGESKLFDALTAPMKDFARYLEQHEPEIDASLGKIATAFATVATSWEKDFQAAKWDSTADELTKTAGALGNMAVAFSKFAAEAEKDLPILQGVIGALLGARVGCLFGPVGALVGAGVGGLAPGMIEHELNPDEPHSADVWGAVKGWWSSHAPSWLGGSSSAGGGNKGVGGWWTPERMAHAADRLEKEAGLSATGAAALVARWAAVESSGGPTSVNPGSGAIGIGQWLDRKPAFLAWAKANGLDPNDFDTQIGFAAHELNTTERRSADVLRNASTAGQGAAGASMYERAEGFNGVTDNFTGSTPVASVLDKINKFRSAPTLHAPSISASSPYPALDPSTAFSAAPWGIPSGGGGPITSTVTNNVNVSSSDPGTAAAAVGLHLDRTSADIARNLQGAVQ